MKVVLLIFLLIKTNFYGQEQSFKFDKLIVPKSLEESAHIAIQYYPELKNINIEIVFANTKTTMETRPVVVSLFAKQRKYKIFVDTLVENNYGLLASEVPLNAQIGLFGHEFAHIIDYENKSNFEIIKIGKTYLTKGDIKSYETYIDKLTIQRGLGLYLKAWAEYVLNQSSASEEYKNYKKKNYLTPEEIQIFLNNLSKSYN